MKRTLKRENENNKKGNNVIEAKWEEKNKRERIQRIKMNISKNKILIVNHNALKQRKTYKWGKNETIPWSQGKTRIFSPSSYSSRHIAQVS